MLVGLAVTLCSATVVVALGLLADAASATHGGPDAPAEITPVSEPLRSPADPVPWPAAPTADGS